MLSLESEISLLLKRHLRNSGFIRTINGELSPPGDEKDVLRAMHRSQRSDVLAKHRAFIKSKYTELNHNFADGIDVNPEDIWPKIELVESGTWQSDLFRLASLTWSIPVSQGYGRRLRFLVWDETNNKLMGLIALGDPVFNLKVRDEWIGWSADERKARLVNVLDAYVLGAIPPYNFLLGGKLIASLVSSIEVHELFSERYGRSRGIISGKQKRASLALVTTTSAFGRSSMYNRLKVGPKLLFTSLGYTQGYGHFHIPDKIFGLVREYLEQQRSSYANNFEFGEGANWRLRALRQAFSLAGINPHLLKHGVKREVFAAPVASNAKAFLAGEERIASFDDMLSVSQLGLLARERWIVSRAKSDPSFVNWKRSQVQQLLSPLAGSRSVSSPLGMVANGAS